MRTVLVVPDGGAPSGGGTYDRRLRDALAVLGRPVREAAVPGAWPDPDPESRAGLSRVLAGVPDGTAVLLDGLVACGVPEVLLPHASRLRLVVLVHLPLADETGLPEARAAALDGRERTVLRAASAVVATSRWAARRVADHHGIGGVHVVEPGVEPAPLSPAGDGSRLLCVASVTPRKGHDVLLSALAGLADLPWRCVCVGPGAAPGLSAPGSGPEAHAERLRGLVRAHGLAARVEFAGPLTGDALEAAYTGSDLLVLPSRAETYGMVVTEALARGIPVAATEVGGVPEALGLDADGRRPGMLVPPGDPVALAVALRRWLTDSALRDRLRRSARARREGLAGWEEAARGMAAVLDGEEKAR
ncbi:glycosyltransferase family 4 protein [Nocardiopsis sp. CT-R113]|uniref:Glycosyltransferase family 4 protein n=1 Tax=Nocardiopsis codii TaxID=3065942 RepID=A0ABU7K646_9ACTN|nr:glycosyltransferase family 4 protein [Nocardiopsis sp. CT-R113]MEE2037507.1 glycosyltransferase family 4 protein [Nocardiopsis sp. CT-R113]